jgi:hypothetical protein
MATFDEMRGTTVYDSNHDKIGTLEEFYVDDETNKPKWITVKTGLFGTKSSFVPLAEAQETEDGLQVAFTKGQVSEAPNVEIDDQIDEHEEDMLFTYYKGIFDAEKAEDDDNSDATQDDSADDEDETDDDTDDEDDDLDDSEDRDDSDSEDERAADAAALAATNRDQQNASTNSDQPRTPGTLRLKRYVVTENVQFTVPVQREVVRLEPADEDEDDTDEASSTSADGEKK